MKYLLIINELSGSAKHRLYKQRFVERLQKYIYDDVFFKDKEVFYMSIINPFFNNQDIVDLIVEKKITHLILGGGDGTFQTIINFIYKHQPQLIEDLIFGFLPLGSGNGFVRHLKTPNTEFAILKMLIRNKILKIDVLHINNQILSIHNVGAGFDAIVVDEYNKISKRGSDLYNWLVVKNINKIPKFSIEIIAENIHEKIDAVTFLACNTNQLGNNLRLTPKAVLNDGMLDVIIVPHQPLKKLLYNFLSFVIFPKFNNDFQKNKVIYFQTKKICMKCEQGVISQNSGDILERDCKEITCEVWPQFLKTLT